MNKKERIAAAIEGERPDRLPYAFWGPGLTEPESAEIHAGLALDFQKEWDGDLLVTVNGTAYSSEDYIAPGFTKVGGVAYVTDPEDWARLSGSSVNGGALAREQEALKLILSGKEDGAPVLFRVMSPLATVFRLGFHVREDIRRGAGAMVKEALRTVTETSCALVQRVIELGADGIFFEAPYADYEIVDENFYREYGAPYDLAVLSASSGWCNVLRAGETNCMFPLLRKYPGARRGAGAHREMRHGRRLPAFPGIRPEKCRGAGYLAGGERDRRTGPHPLRGRFHPAAGRHECLFPPGRAGDRGKNEYPLMEKDRRTGLFSMAC